MYCYKCGRRWMEEVKVNVGGCDHCTSENTTFSSVILTKYGDKLDSSMEYKNTFDIIVEGNIGTHEGCAGTISTKQISETFSALDCGNCNLRVMLPIWVKTYSDLMNWSLMTTGE